MGKNALTAEKLPVLLSVLAGLLAFLHLFPGLTSDSKVLLHYATLLISEGGLYTNWQEINPPLIMMIYALPALALKFLHAPPAAALNVVTVLLCCASIAMTWHALRAHAQRKLWTAFAAFALFVAPAPFWTFADREHLLYVFALPWLIQMLLGLRPAWYTIVFAAPGFFLKPFNLLIFGAVLLFGGPAKETLLEKFLSQSALVTGVLGLVYLGILFIFFPGYLHDTLPLVMTTYGTIRRGFLPQLLWMQIFTVAAAPFLWLRATPSGIRPWALYSFLAAATAVYLLNSGWIYTLYLLAVPCLFLVIAPYAGDNRKGKKITDALLALTALAGIFCLELSLYCTYKTGYGFNYLRLPEAYHTQLKKAAGDEFVMLSPTLWATNISAFGQTPRHIYAYDNLWPLPWLSAHQDSPRAAEVKEMMVAPLVAALKNRPVLLVDESKVKRGLPDDADILSLLADPRIKKALSGYRKTDTFDACGKIPAGCRFTVWKAPKAPSPLPSVSGKKK